MKFYIPIFSFLALCSFSAMGDQTSPISQIPKQFLGAWIEKNGNTAGDTITIKPDRLIWTRTDKLNKGDYTISADKMFMYSNGTLTFTVKNKQSATVEGIKDAVAESDMTVIVHSDNDKLQFEDFIFVLSGSFGGPAMGGQERDVHWFEKQ